MNAILDEEINAIAIEWHHVITQQLIREFPDFSGADNDRV